MKTLEQAIEEEVLTAVNKLPDPVDMELQRLQNSTNRVVISHIPNLDYDVRECIDDTPSASRNPAWLLE